MKTFFNSNLFNAILAVVMAVFLLFYVASAENPVVEKPFPNISVAVNGLAEGYILESEPGPVEIRVSGYRSTMNLTFPRDVRAYVDMSNAHPGKAEYVIHYILPTGVSLVSIRPDYVELNVDVYETRELPVVVTAHNEVRQGFSSLPPVASPASVIVSGPRRLLDQIEEAVVSVDLHDLMADVHRYVPVTLLDTEGHVYENPRVGLSDDEVSVHVVVLENLSSKSVSVHAAFSGRVDDHYIMAGMEVHPSTVKITGPYAAVSPIEYLNTEAIDLGPMTDTYYGYVRLLAPPGVEILEGDMVEVTIRIEKNLSRRTVAGIPIEIRNAPPGVAYEASPSEVEVSLAAFADVLESAVAEGGLAAVVAVYVDLEGQPAGDGDYPLYVEADDDYQATLVSADTAKVTAVSE